MPHIPLTNCLCLFNQLLGTSFRLWSTTWLLCSRLVRSYHAVVIMAFSRCRFLIIWSLAACVVGSSRLVVIVTQTHTEGEGERLGQFGFHKWTRLKGEDWRVNFVDRETLLREFGTRIRMY
jgi:hypothetical protein